MIPDRTSIVSFVLCILLMSTSVLAAAKKETDFFDVLRACFDSWDLNHDGILSGDEISIDLQNPAYQGKQAAALAALKTQERFDMRSTNKFSDFTLPEVERLQAAYAQGDKAAVALVRFYNGGIGKISKQASELFKYGSPHISHIRQGHTSDCYFLAPVASMTEVRPQDLVKMIQANEDNTFTVRLHHFSPVLLRAPTEGEIATYTDAGDDGIWLMLLEKAYAMTKLRDKHVEMLEALDLTTIHGGSSGKVIYYLTGHGSKHIKFTEPFIADTVRKIVSEALAAHRVITTGVPGHCLALLKYDAPSDSVLIWNPWGSSSLYKAVAEKMEHGYFWVSINDFVQKFKGITVENLEQNKPVSLEND